MSESLNDIDLAYSTTGHRPGCGFWGVDPTGECFCFDDDEDLDDLDGSDYYVDGDTDW